MNYFTKCIVLITSTLTCLLATPVLAVDFVNTLSIPGESTDLIPGSGANVNRLGMFSDLYYDRFQNVYYGLSDRGPGGGVISYNTRVQKFTLNVNPNTGAISNFNVIQTILFKDNGISYNGLNPQLLNGSPSVLGLSFDPEGFAVAPNGNLYVSDEYGPSVYEFNPNGSFLRAFTTPNNLIPRDNNNTPNYVAGRSTITSGRQDNRGFEGLALSPDGSKLYAMLQDPLVNEGLNPNNNNADGRYSRNLRLVEFDTQSGQSTAQYIYQLESLTDINSRVPSNPFDANSQGRNIGISAIIPVNNTEFLVLERDNRGFGVDPILGSNPPVASKRVYKISLTGATDVSNISLAGMNTLPGNVTPVTKSLFLDVLDALTDAGQMIPEKLEGLTIGPQLANGDYALLLGTDNDYSVTQIGSGTQFDVCTDGTTAIQVPIDSGCPSGFSLIPGYLYSLRVSPSELGNFVPLQQVPEPTTNAALIALGLAGFGLRYRQFNS